MNFWKQADKDALFRRAILSVVDLAIIGMIAVQPAHSQFGIDIAALLAGLKEVNNTLNSAVGAPLKVINNIERRELNLPFTDKVALVCRLQFRLQSLLTAKLKHID